MAITVKPLSASFVAEIDGIDLRQPVGREQFAVLEAAFNTFAVLVFHDQRLTDEQQIAFGTLFGPLETSMLTIRKDARQRLGRPEMADVSNLDERGEPLSVEDRRRMFNIGNQLWHTDSSFKRVPARCSILSGREVPPAGGETEFADLRAAYDALDAATKSRIEGLIAEHSIFHSRAKTGYANFSAEERAQLPPVPQVLVRVHPGSGRKTLYLASHASHVVGLAVENGRRLIDELTAHATQARFVHRHTWRPYDLVMWDDRCTMHRGRPFDDQRYKRDMRRVTVSDEIPSVEREAARLAEAAA